MMTAQPWRNTGQGQAWVQEAEPEQDRSRKGTKQDTKVFVRAPRIRAGPRGLAAAAAALTAPSQPGSPSSLEGGFEGRRGERDAERGGGEEE